MSRPVTLVLLGGCNLHWYDVTSSCLGLLNNGDGASYDGSYTISPAQKITSL